MEKEVEGKMIEGRTAIRRELICLVEIAEHFAASCPASMIRHEQQHLIQTSITVDDSSHNGSACFLRPIAPSTTSGYMQLPDLASKRNPDLGQFLISSSISNVRKPTLDKYVSVLLYTLPGLLR